MASNLTDAVTGLHRLVHTEDQRIATRRVQDLVSMALLAIALRDACDDVEREAAIEAIRDQAAGLDWVLRG